MKVTTTLSYPADPARVARMLLDPAFQDEVCQATGALRHSVEVDGSTVRSVRELPTDNVPSFVKSLVGETLTVTRTDVWGESAPDGSRRGTTTVEIAKAPVRLTADLALHPTATGSVVDLTGDLKASIPFLGGKVETAAEPAVMAAMRAEEQVGARWLAR